MKGRLRLGDAAEVKGAGSDMGVDDEEGKEEEDEEGEGDLETSGSRDMALSDCNEAWGAYQHLMRMTTTASAVVPSGVGSE